MPSTRGLAQEDLQDSIVAELQCLVGLGDRLEDDSVKRSGLVSAGPAGPVPDLNLLCSVIQAPPPAPFPGWVSISPSADRRRAGEASTGLQSAPGLAAQTCSCVGAASLGRKLISVLETMPEVGPVLAACSDEGWAGEVMWEVAAEAGSKPRFLCWPGVTLFSLPCSVAPTSLAYTKLWLYKGRQVLLEGGPAPSSAPWWL